MAFYKLTKKEIKEIKLAGTGWREDEVLDNKGLTVVRKGPGKNDVIIAVYKKGVNPTKSYGANDKIEIRKTTRKGYKTQYDITG